MGILWIITITFIDESCKTLKLFFADKRSTGIPLKKEGNTKR